MANCRNCGAQINDGEKFCSVCGAPIDIVNASYDGQGTYQQNTQNTYQQDAQNTQNTYQQDAQNTQNTYQQNAQNTQNTYQQNSQNTYQRDAQNTYQQNAQNAQNTYQQPYVKPEPESDASLTIGNWMLTIFLTVIPIVGIVMLFIWSFSAETPLTKKNWARAVLIWKAIEIILFIIFLSVFGTLLFTIGR